jgi:hypothetical protein
MATNLWAAAEGVVEGATANIDFYNILTKVYGPWNKNSTRQPLKPTNLIVYFREIDKTRTSR